MTYQVPDNWAGKTLRQIEQETNASGQYFPDRGALANMLGVSDTTPLQKNQTFEINTSDQGSGEAQFITKNLKEVTAQTFADNIVKAAQEQITKETDFLKSYDASNPFTFDEMAARQASTAEYSPYYGQLLQDYLSGVELKRSNVQDEQKLSQTLNALDTSARSRAYDQAVNNAKEGFAGEGLFFSGAQMNATGQKAVNYNTAQEAASAQYGTAQKGYERTLTGYGQEEAQQRRDIGNNQTAAIEQGVLQRKGEAQSNYLYGRQTAYQRQFPTSDASSGYTIPDYLRY